MAEMPQANVSRKKGLDLLNPFHMPNSLADVNSIPVSTTVELREIQKLSRACSPSWVTRLNC
jgi:hypothetical protein